MAKKINESNETKTSKPRAKRGPTLSWTRDRDRALAETMASGTQVTNKITAALKEHPAFEGDAELLTDAKVRQRVKYLQKHGVELPSVSRSRYVPDTEGLNALLDASGGEGAQANEGVS